MSVESARKILKGQRRTEKKRVRDAKKGKGYVKLKNIKLIGKAGAVER